jgi:uncharacterized membrane protein
MSQDEHQQQLRDAASAIDELRSQRREQLPAVERSMQEVISRIGRPRFVFAVSLFIIGWVVANMLLQTRHANFDGPTFGLLNLIAQLTSLVLVIGILTAENTQGTLSRERSRLMLQLALIQDRKITEALKAIEELRGSRRAEDDGGIRQQLANPTDVHEAAQALREVEQQDR